MQFVNETSMLLESAEPILRWARRTPPHFVIGGAREPYLRRWIMVPESAAGAVYLHQILRDDDDRALHDHPWDASICILRGAYREVRKDCPGGELFETGSFRHMAAETAHRLVVVDGPVWTLLFRGPDRREWGFHCPQGWVPWQQFVDTRDRGVVGRGCA